MITSTQSRFSLIEKCVLSETDLTGKKQDNKYLFTTPKKFECDSKGFLAAYKEDTRYWKDGILFAKKDAEYVSGSNPSLLLWKDKKSCFHGIGTQKDGSLSSVIECVLELNTRDELVTIDNKVLGGFKDCIKVYTKKNIRRGDLYKVNIGIVIYASECKEEYKFHGFEIVEKNSHTYSKADNWSKIVFQHVFRTDPITVEKLISGIQESENEMLCVGEMASLELKKSF